MKFSVFGQTSLTPDIATAFVHDKINTLNLELWNAVHIGEIKAYENDSLATEKPSEDIREWANPVLSTILFDSINGFKGVNLSYDFEYSNLGIQFKIRALAPLFTPSTESGVDLGIIPLFWVKRKSLKQLFSKKEYEFYDALFKQRMTLGDFMNPYFYRDENMTKFGSSATSRTVFEEPVWNVFTHQIDTAIGHHLFSLLTFASTNYQQEEGVNIFYQDRELTKLYECVPFDLAVTDTVLVPNPENPENPKDLIPYEVWEQFWFWDVSSINITRLDKDYLLELINRKAENERFVYVKYSSLAKYLIKNDRIILEALLKEITTPD